jgi:hypothetical protein
VHLSEAAAVAAAAAAAAAGPRDFESMKDYILEIADELQHETIE